ncbi:MAG: VanW family protein [bacterium]|nr:VanW family protein [bacterium]
MKANAPKIIILFLVVGWEIYGTDNFIYQWSSYTTYFKQNIDDRVINIKNAANCLDGYIFEPRTIFSFNENITAKIPEDHFGVASVLVGDKRVPGDGGGLGQVSSTLYAASLLAGLSIYERKPHSKIVSYIPAGLDATVSNEEGVDLKIYNPYSCKLIIKTSVRENCLTVSIYGFAPKPRDIRIFSSKPQKAGNFIYVSTIREVCSGGKLIFSEVVSRDRYIACE